MLWKSFIFEIFNKMVIMMIWFFSELKTTMLYGLSLILDHLILTKKRLHLVALQLSLSWALSTIQPTTITDLSTVLRFYNKMIYAMEALVSTSTPSRSSSSVCLRFSVSRSARGVSEMTNHPRMLRMFREVFKSRHKERSASAVWQMERNTFLNLLMLTVKMKKVCFCSLDHKYD